MAADKEIGGKSKTSPLNVFVKFVPVQAGIPAGGVLTGHSRTGLTFSQESINKKDWEGRGDVGREENCRADEGFGGIGSGAS